MDRRRFIVSGCAIVALAWFGADAKNKRKRRRKARRDDPQLPAPTPPSYKFKTLSGNGPATSESFLLDEGSHLASLDIAGVNFSGGIATVGLYNVFGLVEYLFIEQPKDATNYRYERFFDVPEPGLHYIKVSGIDQHWSVTIVPRCEGCPTLPPAFPPLPLTSPA